MNINGPGTSFVYSVTVAWKIHYWEFVTITEHVNEGVALSSGEFVFLLFALRI